MLPGSPPPPAAGSQFAQQQQRMPHLYSGGGGGSPPPPPPQNQQNQNHHYQQFSPSPLSAPSPRVSYGLGMTLEADPRSSYYIITNVHPSSDAVSVVKCGDVLIGIDEFDCANMTPLQLKRLLVGAEGSTVTLTLRGSGGKRIARCVRSIPLDSGNNSPALQSMNSNNVNTNLFGSKSPVVSPRDGGLLLPESNQFSLQDSAANPGGAGLKQRREFAPVSSSSSSASSINNNISNSKSAPTPAAAAKAKSGSNSMFYCCLLFAFLLLIVWVGFAVIPVLSMLHNESSSSSAASLAQKRAQQQHYLQQQQQQQGNSAPSAPPPPPPAQLPPNPTDLEVEAYIENQKRAKSGGGGAVKTGG